MNSIYSSIALGGGLLFFSACGSNSTPSPTAPTPPVTVVSTSAVTVTGAAQTGASLQLTATARMSDGSSKDVTSLAAWESLNHSLATVSASGLLTVVAAGGVDVRATYQSVAGTLQLQVVGLPTFEISGVVAEVAPGSKILPGVRLQITDGPDAGTTVMSDAGGFYKFAALKPGVIVIEATMDGYLLWRVSNLTVDKDYLQWEVVLFPTVPTDVAGARATTRCNDGTWSWAQTIGEACTVSGGIAYPVCPGIFCDGLTARSAR